MKEEANRINQSTEGLKAQFEELQKGFQVRKQMYEGAELMSDSYQHMYDRMRVKLPYWGAYSIVRLPKARQISLSDEISSHR